MLYNVLLFLHIIGAVGMGAALFLELVAQLRVRRVHTIEQAREWLVVTERLGPVFGVSSLLLLVPGLIMTFMQWGWGTGWIDLALLLALALMILGPLVNGRRGAALLRVAEGSPDGPLTPALRAQLCDPVLWISSTTMAGAMVGIIALMTLKPGFVGALIILIVALILGFAVAQLTKPSGREAAPVIAPDAGV